MDIQQRSSKQILNKGAFTKYKNKKRGEDCTMDDKTCSKDKSIMLKVPYIVKKDKDGYVVECIDLDIVTQGDTLKEARKNIKEAIELHFKSASELGILDEVFEKLGVIKSQKNVEISRWQLNSAPIKIPSCML